MGSMQRVVWILIIALITPSVVVAGEWEKALSDIEVFESIIGNDEEDAAMQEEDAILEDSVELFPALDEEEDKPFFEEDEETHVIIKVDGGPVRLSDVPKDRWFANYVADVAALKIISGYRDPQGRLTGKFGPADSITLEQLAKMAVLVAGIDPHSCTTDLKNDSARGRWSELFIACAEQHGWVVYSEGTADPVGNALRSEVVVTILQAFERRISPVSGTMFKDVTRSTVYGNAIETAATDGIVSGYSDEWGRETGYFGARDRVNRAEAAKMFSNAHSVYGD